MCGLNPAPCPEPWPASLQKLAFQYLEELVSEFSRLYGPQIDSVARPYAFIKFGAPRSWPRCLSAHRLHAGSVSCEQRRLWCITGTAMCPGEGLELHPWRSLLPRFRPPPDAVSLP